MPLAKVSAVGAEGLHPVVGLAGRLARSLMTIEFGIAGVSVLRIKSFLAERETSAFGVTLQEQQATMVSFGSNTYTFVQILPPASVLPSVPELLILTNESPMFRLDA